jgi:hypothetical protein
VQTGGRVSKFAGDSRRAITAAAAAGVKGGDDETICMTMASTRIIGGPPSRPGHMTALFGDTWKRTEGDSRCIPDVQAREFE